MENTNTHEGLKRSFKEVFWEALERTDALRGKTGQELITEAIVEKAISGDIKAFEVIRSIIGADSDSTLVIYIEDGADELSV